MKSNANASTLYSRAASVGPIHPNALAPAVVCFIAVLSMMFSGLVVPDNARAADRIVVKDDSNVMRFSVEDNGVLTATKGLFGTYATNARATRSLNQIGPKGVMRLWRIHDLNPPAFELIGSKPGAPDTKLSSWLVSAGPQNGQNIFSVMDRIGGDYLRFVVTHSGNVGFGLGNTMPSYKIHVKGGAYCTGTQWVNASSRELKENIASLTTEEAVEAFEKLDPVKFNYKIDPGDANVGFIAEDAPDLVATKDRNGLSAMEIVAVLTKVVQQQQKTISELNEKVRALEEANKEK